MPIITKPSPLEKDATGIFSLDKTALALHPLIVASAHFSSPNVWEKIIVKYKSETLGQFESIEFDATIASPEGQFFVSATAEDIFEVEKITIIDKDGAILLIPRAELTVAEFDIDFSGPPFTGTYLTYELNTVGATLNATGGVSGGNAGDDVYAKDSSGAAGDFTYEWKFNWSSINASNILFGVTGTYDSGLWYDKLTCLQGVPATPTKALIWVNGSQGVVSDISIPNQDNIYKLTRVGTTISHYLNGVLIHSSTVALFTAYPTVRTKGLAACSESYMPSAPAVQAVTWNEAGKTGIGTVTTGANGLITKATGGGDYNVNVLSNETIIGDGYFEFVNSSLLNLNNSGVAIIGLAEQASLTGGYNNVIHGLYTVNNNWHEIFNGAWSGSNNTSTIGETVRFERIGSEFYIKLNGVTRWQRTISNTNPLKLSISMYTVGTGVDNATVTP